MLPTSLLCLSLILGVTAFCPPLDVGPRLYDWTNVVWQTTFINTTESTTYQLDFCDQVTVTNGGTPKIYGNVMTDFSWTITDGATVMMKQLYTGTNDCLTRVEIFCRAFSLSQPPAACSECLTRTGDCVCQAYTSPTECAALMLVAMDCPDYESNERLGFNVIDISSLSKAVSPFVVQNGVATKAWDYTTPSTLLGQDQDEYIVFSVYLTTPGDRQDYEDIVFTTSEEGVAVLSAVDSDGRPAAGQVYGTVGNAPTTLTLSVSCLQTKSVTIYAEIVLEGSQFANPKWGWIQVCEAPSWSPFGVFCFVLFILILVTCVGGCVYNSKVKGKQGIEMILCVDVFRLCYAKIARRPHSRYEDSTVTDTHSAPGGSSASASWGNSA